MAKKPTTLEPDDEEIEDATGQDDEGQGGEGQASDAAEQDDEGGEGPEPEADEDRDVDDDDQEAAPPSRGETRQQRLANENRQLREQLARSTRPEPPSVAQPQEETEEAFRARIALLPPDERMDARLERSERINNRRMHAMAMQSADATDRATYDAKAASDGRYKRYAADVEAKRQELIGQGQIVPREVLLKYLIGERVLERQGSAEARRQQAKGKERVARQTVRPSGGRSDVQGDRRAQSDADKRRQRLENMDI
jgi:hypothetical protein